jgi:ribonuclease G
MKSGGYIIFDYTEAMVVIDVNSGRSVNVKDHELNALKTNLEGAREIAHQLRLRDIGGIIVIDFIDLSQEKNRKKVVGELKKELSNDRAAFDILPMSDIGLVQMTRERVRPSLLYQFSEPCPRCHGLGRVVAKSSIITMLERKIQQIKIESGQRRMVLKAHPDIISYITKGLRNHLLRLKLKYFVSIKLIPDEDLADEAFHLSLIKDNGKVR